MRRGDTDCSVTLGAEDVVSALAALGGVAGCDNDDCDRDGAVTSADVDCAATCLFEGCPIPDAAARVTAVTPELGSGVAPFSTVRVEGTGFGEAGDPKFVTIGGVNAEVIEIVDAGTLLVSVPLIEPGPADIVVNAGAVDGFPFPLTIGEPQPVGDPDTFDGVLELIEVAAGRFAQLPLDLVYGDDAAFVRQQLDAAVNEIAARRVDLEADPNFTPDLRAFVDAALDSSGAPEELRRLIAEIDDILASGGDGSGAQNTAVVAAKALQKARTLKVAGAAAAAAAGGGPITLGAVVAFLGVEIVLFSLGELVIFVNATNNPPLISRITFTDANGMQRPYPTGGGTARIEGMRFSASDTLVRIETPSGPFVRAAGERDGALIVEMPDAFFFCGRLNFVLLRTVFDVPSNKVPARVQPELLDLSVQRVRLQQPVSVQVRGTAGCRAKATLSDDSEPIDFDLDNLTARAATFKPFSLLPKTYRLRVEVDGLSSTESRSLEITPALVGLRASCDETRVFLQPESPSETTCKCEQLPPEASFGSVAIRFAADNGVTIREDTTFAQAAAVADRTTTAGAVKCMTDYLDRRQIVSEPFLIEVVDRTEPTVNLSAPPAEVAPGATVDFAVDSEDNDFITRIVLRATGEAVVNGEQEKLCTLLESSCSKPFTVELRRSGFTNRDVTVAAEAFDGAGNKGTSSERTFTVRALTETTPPVVTIQSPQNGGRVRPADLVQVSVRVTDQGENDSGVDKVRIEVTGPAVASGVEPAEVILPMPLETATRAGTFTVRPAAELANISDRTITIEATAVDAAGNMASSTIMLMAGGPPIVARVTPNPAVAGDLVRIFGNGFGESQGPSLAFIGLDPATVTSWSNTEILARVPAISGNADVDVVVDNVRSNTLTLTVLGSGDVRVTLIWDDMNDLDLAVTDPTGATIDFENRFSDSGGALDIDANRNCGVFNDPPRENIFYRTGVAPTGTYGVTVTYFAGCTEPPRPSEFRVELVVDGRGRTLLQGVLQPDGTASASFMRSGGN